MRFFHKFGSLNYDFIGLVNGVLLNSKRKTKFTHAFDYLSKYSYALKNPDILTSNNFQNKIWQCWLQGKENMPEIVNVCTNSVKKYHKEDVIFLDNENISEYIELPKYIVNKHKKGFIQDAHYTDICRLMLLAKYGGCWVDSTVYLTGKIPHEILNAEFFTFRSLDSNLLKNISNTYEFKMYNNHFNRQLSLESSYFISAKSGNKIINSVLNLLLEYWKNENKPIDYLFLDQCFSLALLSNEELKKQFLNIPEFYIDNVMLLQNSLFEHFDKKLYLSICNQSPIHKLTHKNLHRNPYKDSFLMYLLNHTDLVL